MLAIAKILALLSALINLVFGSFKRIMITIVLIAFCVSVFTAGTVATIIAIAT